MFTFKKIASVLTSAAMLSSTVALAAAANFPAPFVQNGAANVAIVYGSSASVAVTDIVAASDIQASLSDELARQTATGGTQTAGTVTGEAFPLFTSSSPLLVNNSLNAVAETVTSTDLPTVLADGSLQGNVAATYEQRIIIGNNPVVKYAKQPSDSNDPQTGIALSTSPSNQYVYNATVTFDQNVNFTHSDTIGEKLNLFGQDYTVSGATTATKLVLLKSSQAIALSSDGTPTATVTVDGKEYTIELVAASDTAATVKVTNAEGVSQSKEITEATSKTVNGIEVGIDTADENNFRLTAQVLVGSQRITLQDNNNVKVGSDEDLIDGTNVRFEAANGTTTTSTHTIGKLIFQVAAKDSDTDAVIPGQAFVDPIFGTFKVDFAGLTQSGTADREDIKVANSGNDKMTVTFQSLKGSEAKTFNWAYNKTDSQAVGMDLADVDGDTIVVSEMGLVNKSGYVVLANDDEGGLFEVTQISNSSSATASDDELTIKNVLTGDETSAKATTEGTGTITVVGKTFTYTYYGAQNLSNSKAMQVRFNAPESTSNDMILFPTVKTRKGAKLGFYEPTTVTLNNWNGAGANLANVSNFQLPDGDGYTAVAITNRQTNGTNYTIGGTSLNLTAIGNSTTVSVGKLTYNFTATGTVDAVNVSLVSPQGGNIVRPAIYILEGKDEVNNYEAVIVSLDAGYDADSAGIGVNDVVRTVEADAGTNFGNEIQHESDSDLYSDIDLWGTISTLDKSDSDQTTATISYPADQVRALVYVAENSASISTGGSTSGSVKSLGSVLYTDSEATALTSKNLIVVGGSCINTVAADLLGSSSPLCGADFTAKTGVASGEFLVQTFSRTGGNVATLVAGYHAGDTVNAAKYLTTQTVDTAVDKKYKGTTSTTASLVTS